MKKSYTIIFVSLLLTGCMTPEQRVALQQQQQEQYQQHLLLACEDFGFQQGTPPMLTCLNKTRQANQQLLIQHGMTEAQVLPDERILAQSRQHLISICKSQGFKLGTLEILDCASNVHQADLQHDEIQRKNPLSSPTNLQMMECTPMNDGAGTVGCMTLPRP